MFLLIHTLTHTHTHLHLFLYRSRNPFTPEQRRAAGICTGNNPRYDLIGKKKKKKKQPTEKSEESNDVESVLVKSRLASEMCLNQTAASQSLQHLCLLTLAVAATQKSTLAH